MIFKNTAKIKPTNQKQNQRDKIIMGKMKIKMQQKKKWGLY